MYIALPSPFGLPDPDPAWWRVITDYDADLVLYPSQKDYVYRLARRARQTGGMNGKIFGPLPNLHPDTQVCLNHGLVAVTTIPVAAIHAPAENIVKQLAARDLWAHGGAEKVSDMLDAKDAAAEAAIDKANREGVRDRIRSMRVGFLHRTGARVSLVSPRRSQPTADSPLLTPGVSSDT